MMTNYYDIDPISAVLGHSQRKARLFFAVKVPADQRDRLKMLQSGLPDVRWVRPDGFHITLAFLGEVTEAFAEECLLTLQDIRQDPFDLTLQGVKTFGDKKPRILYADVIESKPLIHLQSCVETRLRAIGADLETRKFRPHVTLARMKRVNLGRLAQYLEARSDFFAPSFQVTEYHLYSSVTHPEGAIYTPEATLSLSA